MDRSGSPTVNELISKTPPQRLVARYLIPRNPERTEKITSIMGASVTRRIVMGTVGRIAIRAPHSNYRLDPTKSIAERSMRFAVGGSVFNELWHTHAAIDNLYSFAARPSLTTVGFMMLNLSLVNLQRYNRARMVKRVNEEMANGDRLTGYTNWLGIDGGAARQIGDDG